MVIAALILIVLGSSIAAVNVGGLIEAYLRGRRGETGSYSSIPALSLICCTLAWYLSRDQFAPWVFLPALVDPSNWLLLASPVFWILRSRGGDDATAQSRGAAQDSPPAGYESRVASLEEPIESQPDRVQLFLVGAARMLPGLPDQATHALEVAERFHRGNAGADDLAAVRDSCWQLCGPPGGQIDSPDVAVLRATICALYPSIDDPFETVCFFFQMSHRCGGPLSEQLDLLRAQLAGPTAPIR